MQLGILNLLLGLPNGALANGQGQGKAPGVPDMFAQLLGERGQGKGQQLPMGGQLAGDLVSNALVAQEMPADGDVQALSDLLGQEISAEDAAALLEQFDAMMSGEQDEGGTELLQELKAALTEIKDSKTSQTVGAILANLPALHAAPVERAPAVERMLAWIQGALKPKEAPQDVATDDAEEPSVSPLTQSLQASMFRTDTAAPSQTEEAAGRDSIEIIPLSLTLETNAPTWVKQITAPPVRGDLEAAIPSLTPANDDLPQINLPRIGDGNVTDIAAFRTALENQTAHRSDEPVLAPTASTAHTEPSHTPPTITAPHAVMNHAPVVGQVHVAISRASKDGIDQLTLQLEPADLGRVEVKMHRTAEGHTQLTFLVDKADTLDALARDARSLERALQEAGIKADAGSMQFNLRQQNQQAGDGEQQGQSAWGRQNGEAVAQEAVAEPVQNYTLTLRDGVDIRA